MFGLAKISNRHEISLLRRILILPTLWRLGPNYIYVEGEPPIFDPSVAEDKHIKSGMAKLKAASVKMKADPNYKPDFLSGKAKDTEKRWPKWLMAVFPPRALIATWLLWFGGVLAWEIVFRNLLNEMSTYYYNAGFLERLLFVPPLFVTVAYYIAKWAMRRND